MIGASARSAISP